MISRMLDTADMIYNRVEMGCWAPLKSFATSSKANAHPENHAAKASDLVLTDAPINNAPVFGLQASMNMRRSFRCLLISGWASIAVAKGGHS